MKKKLLILTAIISLTCYNAFSQINNHKKIKALKIAFITQALDLTTKEAQNFWPIFNEYDKLEFNLRIVKMQTLNRKIRAAGGIDNFTDAEAKDILNQYLQIERQLSTAKISLNNNLKHVLSAKKIIKLFKAEQDFNKRLLLQFRKKRKEMMNKRRY